MRDYYLIVYRISGGAGEGDWTPDDRFYSSEEEARSNMEGLVLVDRVRYDMGVVAVKLPDPKTLDEDLEGGRSEDTDDETDLS